MYIAMTLDFFAIVVCKKLQDFNPLVIMQMRTIFLTITNSLTSYNYNKSPEPANIPSVILCLKRG